MKNTFYAAITTVLFLAAGFTAQSAHAAGMLDNPTPLKYERYIYFEKNNSGLTGSPLSFLMFYDNSKFDTVFAPPPPPMVGNIHLPDDVFETRFIFAVVKRGTVSTSYFVTNVVRDFDKLRIYYDAKEKPLQGQIVRSPLILAIDNADFDYSEIIVTENGKDIYRAKL